METQPTEMQKDMGKREIYDSWGRELNQLNKINQNKTETYRNQKELNKHNLYAVNLTLKLAGFAGSIQKVARPKIDDPLG